MKRWLLFALFLLLPLASASTSLHLEWELGEQTDVEHRYVEHFPDQMMQCGECNTTNDGDPEKTSFRIIFLRSFSC